MTDIEEPSVWGFDGEDPGRELPKTEANRVEALAIRFDEPIWTPLPDTATEAVREAFRGFFEHTPYRRLATIEQVEECQIVVRAETRESNRADAEWEPALHPADVESMQTTLSDLFGPLWRIRPREQGPETDPSPGTAVVGRMIGRRFHYHTETKADAERIRAGVEEAVADG